jgi:hypothetical protein
LRQRAAARGALWAAVLVAGITTAVTVRFNSYTPWGTDPAEYVASAHRWARGAPIEPSPLALWASWIGDGQIVVPLGARPGVETGTLVSQYPPGAALLMAAAVHLTGDVGPYLVAPLLAGVLVWCTFVLGRELAGEWSGLLAAVLVAASPTVLVVAAQAMGDVPATALWILAWTMSLKRGPGAAAAAGLAAAMAILVRPNLAPFAIVPAVLVLHDRGADGRMARRWGAAALFTAAAALGPILVCWTQLVLYGGPFTPGYVDWQAFYAWAHVAPSLTAYARSAVTLYSPAIAVAVLAPIVLWRTTRAATASTPLRRRITGSAVSLLVLNVLAYAAYTPYTDPGFLRLVLPGLVAIFILVAGATTAVWRQLRGRAGWAAPLALVPVAAMLTTAAGPAVRGLRDLRPTQGHIALVGEYLRMAAPRNAVLLSRLQGGAMAFYTGKPIVRLDLLDPASFDRVVDDLLAAGHAPILLLSDLEEAVGFGAHFAASRFRALDWPPRARAPDAAGFVYYALGDREAHLSGVRVPVDVLRRAP